ncbi:polyprenyl synthetase family protein [Pseudohoeflea suaedae]|uniref:Probable farnesyl diphosphate synthase n=1 Tax=Pseudohoeflea suaedae TaxID=877384 RepID=A0A4R5PL13_9HYPH|nr:farnesyl diphosphate synthase [Pseudohoeflea suaedae]TDH37603.1 polyprenyl synthetase family protein [Pseudohoeflea suaedae]
MTPGIDHIFTDRLSATARDIGAFLDEKLGGATGDGHDWPATLRSAMRHGALNGGKRIRPFLVVETARMLGGDEDAAMYAAAALECIHCYSLIHDDLPAMDDDDMRRGQPTVHIAFDEATAILAGDALLTFAFELLTDPANPAPSETKLDLVRRLAIASGAGGMVGGQVLDLAAETGNPGEDDIMSMQAMKTGALLRHACEAGAIVARADDATIARMRSFGTMIGLAFQLADDLLDATADAKTVGKATGKDAGRNKGTYVSLNGIDDTRARCEALVTEACAAIAHYGSRADLLQQAAAYIARRTS